MLDLLRHWVAFKFDERGVTALEYAIIAGLLGTVLVGAFTALGGSISSALTAVSSKIPQ